MAIGVRKYDINAETGKTNSLPGSENSMPFCKNYDIVEA